MISTTSNSSAIVIPLNSAKKPTTSPDKFEIFRERWLRRITLDQELPAGALRLCIVVSTYTNRHSRDAWRAWRGWLGKPGYRAAGLSNLPNWSSGADIGGLPEQGSDQRTSRIGTT
jgi:hypothetical protein